MKRKILILLLIGLIIMNEAYSKAKEQKTLFVLTQKDEPPFGAKDRLATKGEYGQEFTFLFTNNSNVKQFIPSIYRKKKGYKLYIRTGIIKYHSDFYTFLLNATFNLPKETRTVNEPANTVAWVTDGEYYWLNGFFAEPERPSRRVCNWPKDYDFEEIFVDKLDATEPFECKIELWYRFDDEPEKHLILYYTVEPRKVDDFFTD